MSPGERKIPAPIMFPTVTARPKVTPRTVRRRRAGRGTGEVYASGAPHPGASRLSLSPLAGRGVGGQIPSPRSRGEGGRRPGEGRHSAQSDSFTDTGAFTVDSVTFFAPLPNERRPG